jgi:hypothetical protein
MANSNQIFSFVQEQQSLDVQIKRNIQPVILLSEDIYNSDVMYVVAEGIVLCPITTKKIADALVILMATYYMYNINYNIGKHIFIFLEMTLMGVVSEKSPVSVTTLISMLSNLS